MEIISRDDARAAGLKRYATGLQCPRGHVAERYTSTGQCSACQAEHRRSAAKKNPDIYRARALEWYYRNRESATERSRRAYHANKEKWQSTSRRWKENNQTAVLDYSRAYYQQNSEQIKLKSRRHKLASAPYVKEKRSQHYERNKDKELAQARLWRLSNRDRMNYHNALRRAAKLQATPKWADRSAIAAIYRQARELKRELGEEWHVDHIVPLQSPVVCGLHCEANLQLLPGAENMKKGNRYWPDMWAANDNDQHDLFKQAV
jgi:hypothetical protein